MSQIDTRRRGRAAQSGLLDLVHAILWPHGDGCPMCRLRIFPGHGFIRRGGVVETSELRWAP